MYNCIGDKIMTKLLSGIECKNKLKEKLTKKINKIKEKITITVISVGNDEASKIYIRNKIKECQSVNIECQHLHFKETTTNELTKLITKLNKDKNITGILVQLPLPENIDENKVINTIYYKKDIDGLTETNIAKLYLNKKSIIPCTAKGIIDLLEFNKIDIEGKNITIIGRSNLVGKPLSLALLKRNATVTLCHSKTKDLKKHTKKADIIVVAVGKPNLIKKEMISKNSIIVDVGINRINEKICGDVDKTVYKKCKAITPVPGGVGPMTVYEVLSNTLECYKLQKDKK